MSKMNGIAYYNEHNNSGKVITAEMCVYCFEVLENELNHRGSPLKPNFTNEAL